MFNEVVSNWAPTGRPQLGNWVTTPNRGRLEIGPTGQPGKTANRATQELLVTRLPAIRFGLNRYQIGIIFDA